MFYPEEYFQQAFYTEANCIFRNRLISEDHKTLFNDILEAACRQVFDIDKSPYFFAPIGPLSSSVKYVLENEWTETVQRSITICRKLFKIYF